jgi:two-component system nitrogen regulation sensor histidine kinase NtrY
MSLLIVFGAMWFGFRLAKELSAPVQALALGTQRIARGDLSVRLEDKSDDELGFLVQSFNSMAEDLELSRDGLTQANIRLGEQNRELEQRGQYMAVVLNNVTSGVISLDAEGRISTVNRAAEAMLGLDGSLLVGRKAEDFLHGEYQGVLAEVRAQLQANPHALWQRQIELAMGARELKLLVNAVALRSGTGQADAEAGEGGAGTPPPAPGAGGPAGEGTGVVAVFEDISELEKMQRLAAWREVAKRIAHEIKNPLTPIKLSAQRLERKFGPEVDDPAFAQCTGLIVRQVEYLQQMVKEFSSFAKLPEVVLRRDDLDPLLREVVALFEHSHSRIAWSFHLDPGLPELKFDREGMRRVLVNLLTNACEAVDGQEDGRVDVSAALDEPFGRVRIKVADNGPGVAPEERSRLFEPYFSKKKGGTGLGLTIVKSIVSDHHGLIRVKPNHPRGTTFVVDLPSA